MDLLTSTIRTSVLANGADCPGHVPNVKFFNPLGAATWLITELDSGGDTLSRLANLGLGLHECGSVSLAEVASVHLPLGFCIERNIDFAVRFPFSAYTSSTRVQGNIAERANHLFMAPQRRCAQWQRGEGGERQCVR